MEINRLIKQIRKHSTFLARGLRPTALHGRLVGPKVIVNSVPKSGTNLLQEIVTLLPLMRGKVTPTLMNRTDSLIIKLNALKKGQCVPAHIQYEVCIDQAIKENDIRHILIIRDFRDVVYSNIQYVESIHITHPHNKFLSTLSTLDEKIQAILLGAPDVKMIALPDFISKYRAWTMCGSTLVVRFENLISPDSNISEMEIHRIIDYLNIVSVVPDIDVSEIREKMFNPNGTTFNAPGIGKWKKNFNQHQIAMLNQALAEELIFFGYDV